MMIAKLRARNGDGFIFLWESEINDDPQLREYFRLVSNLH